jgi:SAM-dependent methyltransferase
MFSCTNLEHGLHFPIRECKSCKAKFCSPCPTQASLDTLYSAVVDETYLKYEEARRLAARETLKRLPIKKGKLLEVGSYTGVFLEEAQKFGFECYGIEPSSAAVAICKKRGLKVEQGALPGSIPWDIKFDLVVMWDVMEHLYDPLVTVQTIKNMLVPGGEFHFTTIRIDCLAAKILGRKWPWYMPMHIDYFEIPSIKNLCLKAGFESIDIKDNFHYSNTRYLEKKLKSMSFPLNIFGSMLSLVPTFNIRVALGDTVYVRAK